MSTSCIVGKGSAFHVTEALGTTLDEGVAMVADSVRFLRAAGQRVFFDAEHFFDGYKADPEFSLRVLEAAAVEGAEVLVLCDTNGGSLPHEVQRIVAEVGAYFGPDQQLGIHTQNDSGCAVANSVAAVVSGVTHVQGTVNGYGERTGNANLMTVVPDLQLKMGVAVPARGAHRAADRGQPPRGRAGEPPAARGRSVRRCLGVRPQGRAAHVGARQGGRGQLRAHRPHGGRATTPGCWCPTSAAGRACRSRPREFGVDLDDRAAAELSERLKHLEAEGYQFEAADASLELLMREAGGWEQPYFRLEGYRVTTYHRNSVRGGAPIEDGESIIDTEASVKVWVGDERFAAIGEGNGPVNALDAALRQVLTQRYPELGRIHLTDFRVRVLEGAAATGAVVRVLIDSTDGDRTWSTVGVDSNIIEASWQALVDSLVYGILHASDPT